MIWFILNLVIYILTIPIDAINDQYYSHQYAKWPNTLHTNKSIVEEYGDNTVHPINAAPMLQEMPQFKPINHMLDSPMPEQQAAASDTRKESTGDMVFNVHHFTQFQYNGDQVYIYSPIKNNENSLEPQKWAFFYIPVLQPVKVSPDIPWVWVHNNEIRVRLALGCPILEKEARKAVANQFDNETVAQYSHLWVIAPLMLDSLSAYVVTVSSGLVEGVAPFHMDNPVSNTIMFRFACTTKTAAESIARSLLEGDYDIEVSFYFAGMHTAKTNMMTITATQLQSVLSKTLADGGGTNATYIHREQGNSFVSKYMANVKKMIYIEDPTMNMSLITNGLHEQFMALFQEGIQNSKENLINADVFGQVWQSSDLNPDRITSEMSKMFTYNESETQKHSDRMNYYNVNERKDSSLSVHASLDVRVKTLFVKVDVSAKVDYDKRESEEYASTTHETVSESDIKKAASQSSIEGAWEGEKFVPKSFKVFQLSDVTNRLQVAIISKQLMAEKNNGAVIRRVGTSVLSVGAIGYFAGEIKLYAGISPPLYPWLLCDGSIVSRAQYPRLFSVIGTQYGEGNDSTTFQLPDLRGRVAVGVDPQKLRIETATETGTIGGTAFHTLTVDELPEHAHGAGTLNNSNDGVHTHGIHDPGHNHNGRTERFAVYSAQGGDYGSYYYESGGIRQWQSQTIDTDTAFTHISLTANGNHTHRITGSTGTIGQNRSFSIIPPFQALHYIIYAGE